MTDVPEPRLGPFIEDGQPCHIEYIKYLGSGVHAHAWKVTINGVIYALKTFRFGNRYPSGWCFQVDLDEDDDVAFMHPFNCESRAYARLKEEGKEDIAVRCYGYLMLGEHEQAKLRELVYPDKVEEPGHGDASYEGEPLKALVKEFVEYDDVQPWDGMEANKRRIARPLDGPKTAKRLIQSLRTLHRVGILHRDINSNNVVNGRFLDFSTAWTVPHPCLETKLIETRSSAHSYMGMVDAWRVDKMIDKWNSYHPDRQPIWERAGPNDSYLDRLRCRASGRPKNIDYKREYNLRPDLYNRKLERARKTGKAGRQVRTVMAPKGKKKRTKAVNAQELARWAE